LERNAIVVPSGETAGSRAGIAFDEMRCHVLPDGSAVKIFHAPRDSAETINLPVGTSAAGAPAARLAVTDVESSVEAKRGVENVWLETRRASTGPATSASTRRRIEMLISATLLWRTGTIIL
jgi:hypothetical protein